MHVLIPAPKNHRAVYIPHSDIDPTCEICWEKNKGEEEEEEEREGKGRKIELLFAYLAPRTYQPAEGVRRGKLLLAHKINTPLIVSQIRLTFMANPLAFSGCGIA